ncbi:TPA: LysR family transcriptional regulator [Vibrio alginolyticus]|uniref:LysR family transcriptional regulator n=1 Tax=Vibrio TaxID=662 RepID=UPI0014820A73|nr:MULTISPECIES: LysR family transcriptional regulator [Vibrio]MBS9820075.1 LysR family transcriptional regulator [Vibrio alginolyticus]MBS9967269.1 LysR family transcriptional regulator [Vibrio alginolyticus]MBT0017487.1 LysR family transcriptional regulator [Vibrio alginolyticus]MCA2440581.1 LysR family transcriptional regulator [Vibrio alginolyticus]MCR9544030.1 LysR family transcriptional regulator [Vibrio alginolyticus]
MNTLHLKALLLAVETGSISAAARKLGKKQSQVSQWISDLEIDLGVNFFDRTGNKTTLSKDGERLLPHLTHTLSHLDKFVQGAEMLMQNEPTVLTIGIENYIPDIVFTQPLASVLDLPHLSVEVYRDERTQLEQDLGDGHVDVIITHESETIHHKHFDYCRLGYYREILVCSPDHPLAQLSHVTSKDLSEYRELVWGEVSSEDNDGFSPCYCVFSDIDPLIAMLKHNKGFAFLPEECVSTQIENDLLVALNCDFELSGIDRKVELCWRNGLTLSEGGSMVIKAFKHYHLLPQKHQYK